jgi:hypothetical protein
MDGSMTYATVALGNGRIIDLEVTRAGIPSTVKGDKHATEVGGLVDRNITFQGLLDYVTAQQDLIDFLETATPDVTIGTLVFTVATGKTWTWTNGALLKGYTIGSPDSDGLCTFTATWHLNTIATIAWV